MLFQKLSNVGASDRLVRALAGLYVEARGTVRGPDGYATPFDITIGTREGGVESPALYVLFVCDLIARLETVQLEDRPPTLGGKEIRALQKAENESQGLAQEAELIERIERAAREARNEIDARLVDFTSATSGDHDELGSQDP